MKPYKDEESDEFYGDQKVTIKQDTKAHLHLKLWEAEARGDQDTVEKAENAIASMSKQIAEVKQELDSKKQAATEVVVPLY